MLFWVDASSEVAIETGYSSIAQRYGKPNDMTEIKTWLRDESSTWILVLDDFSDSLNAIEYFPPTPKGCLIIVTARSTVLSEFAGAGVLTIGEMTEDEATTLLLRVMNQSSYENVDRKLALDLVKDLGKIALAIDLAGAYIREEKDTISDYRKRFTASKERVIDRVHQQRYTGYQMSIETTWDVSYDAIVRAQGDRHAIALLHFCVFLHPQNIPVSILTEAWNNVERFSDNYIGERYIKLVEEKTEESLLDSIRAAANLLARYSVISVVRDSDHRPRYVSMQPIVHKWARIRMSEDDRRTCWCQAVSTTAAALQTTNLVRDFRGDLIPQVDHLLSKDLYRDRLFKIPGGPEQCYQTLFTFSDVYSETGFPRKSAELRKFICESIQGLSGTIWRIKYAEVSQQLVRNYSDLGEDDEALRLRQEAVGKLTPVIPRDSLFLLSCRSDLSDSLEETGDHETAMKIRQEVLAEYRRSQDRPEYLLRISTASRRLAKSLRNCGQWSEALKELHQSIGNQKNTRAEDDHELLASTTELARSYEDSGELSKALELYDSVLDRRIRYKHKDQDILVAKENVANIYSQFRQYPRALTLRQEIKEGWMELQDELGAEHPNFLIARLLLGKSYADDEKYGDSLIELEKVFEIRQRRLGHDHAATLNTRLEIALIKRRVGDMDGAKVILSEVLTGWQGSRLGTTNERNRGRSRAINELANAHRETMNFEKALSLREQLLDEQSKARSDQQDESILRTMKELVVDYRRGDRDQDAIEIGERALLLQEKNLGDHHPLLCETMVELSNCYRKMNRKKKHLQQEDAERTIYLLKSALKIQEDNQWLEEARDSSRRIKETYHLTGQIQLREQARERENTFKRMVEQSGRTN